MEDQLLEKQLLEAVNHVKNVSKKRVTADRLLSHLKKTGTTNWDQESINDMLCILQCKGTIDGIIAENEEDPTNHDNIDIHRSPVISEPENSYSISTARLAVPHITTPSLNLEKFPLTQIATPTLSTSNSDFNNSLQQLENKLCGKMMAVKSYLMDEIYNLKKQKQNTSKLEKNTEQVNNGLVEELKTKIKLLENEKKLLREEQDNNKKIIDTVLHHNTSLLKHLETLHQNPYSYKSPDVNKKLSADLSKKFQRKKGSKESNENVNSSDNNQNWNNLVYILGDSMLKHVNGLNVSDSMNVKVRSHPGATTEDLVDYVKPIARKKQKMLIIPTGINDLPDDMNTIKKLKKVVHSIHEIDVNQEIKVAFSGIINREDNNFAEKIKDRNTKLESYCKSKRFRFYKQLEIG